MKYVSVVIPLRKQGLKWQAWVQLRREDGPLDGFLEFPGGKIEANESALEAAVRELAEEVHLTISENDLKLFQIINHAYSDRHVCLNFHLLNVTSENDAWSIGEWFDLEALLQQKLLEANVLVLKNLINFVASEPSLGEWA